MAFNQTQLPLPLDFNTYTVTSYGKTLLDNKPYAEFAAFATKVVGPSLTNAYLDLFNIGCIVSIKKTTPTN